MTLALHSMQHFAEQLAIAAGIVIGLGVLGKASWGAWRFVQKAVRLVDDLEETYKDRRLIKAIADEFQPNGGSSVKDILERVDENLAVNARNIGIVYGVVLKMHDLDPHDAPLLENHKPTPKDKETS